MSDRNITTADIATAEEAKESEKKSPDKRPEKSKAQQEGSASGHDNDQLAPLFPPDRVADLRKQWQVLQVGFVDEPRQTVSKADQLVAEVMRELAQSFADQRTNLEHQWDKGDRISTEELRVTLRRYRSFFERLLAI